ncbi:MAG: shikimate dehydrogenase [Candidatus Omnitrophota bacterium]|nr:shikimate dehydrogenase [Candidatus Omnitrophota bacterium]
MFRKSPQKIYGLLGFPAKHSLSAIMHNAAFKALKINAEYKLFEVESNDFVDFLNSLEEQNIFGLNITIPYKERIMDFVSLSFEANYLKRIGAVNTIVNKEGIWRGFNTDIPGFEKHLKENFEPAGKNVAVLGAGGAARAVCYVLAKSNAERIAIFDIDKVKAQIVSNMIKSLFDFNIFPLEKIEELDLRNKDLLVNATPLGLNENDPFPIKEEWLHKDLFVYDLIYNPPETQLLAIAKKIGAKTSNGLGMLLYQGMLSFEIWTGKPAPREAMEGALLEALHIK